MLLPVTAFAGVPDPNPLFIVPFGLLLLCVALLPVFLKHHWERHYPKISVGLGAVAVAYYFFGLRAGSEIVHTGFDYVSFMVVIGTLFVISGGIHIRVRGESNSWKNCAFLLIGTLLGCAVGTTAASMLLIRPWIRMNKYRFTGHHLAFFIFMVSNFGGALTPMGPPLFMGYLKGVPFWWGLHRCLPPWFAVVGCTTVVFYFIDRVNFLRAPRGIRESETVHEEWRFDGLHNILFMGFALACVILLPGGIREVAMIGLAALSYYATPGQVHEANDFTFGPVKEIAWIFAGIFATMKPALDYMVLHAGGLGLHSDAQFYWLSGILSAVLDNAPTYLTFLAAAFGLTHLNLNSPADMRIFLAQHDHYLIAISLGSALFGAMTYLGNGPNLMVKSIAEHAKVHTPGFIGFIVRYSLPLFLPVLALLGWVFFR